MPYFFHIRSANRVRLPYRLIMSAWSLFARLSCMFSSRTLRNSSSMVVSRWYLYNQATEYRNMLDAQ